MTLTPDEWPYVLDALGAAVAELNEKAEMWKGRTRYPIYKMAADEVEAIRVKLDRQFTGDTHVE